MRVKSPTITLLTGAGLGIALLVASMLATAHAAAPSAPAPARSPARTGGAGSPQPPPSRTASASAKAPARATYIAQVHGGGAAVAISVSDERASALVCKGSVIQARLSGAAADGNLTLTGPGHARLRAKYNLRKAAGEVEANGIRYTFSAPASLKSAAGNESVRCEAESRAGTGAGHDGGGHGGDGDGGHGGGGHGGG